MGHGRLFCVGGRLYTVDCGTWIAPDVLVDRLRRLGLINAGTDRGDVEVVSARELEAILRERDGSLCRHVADDGGWCDQKAAPGETRCREHLAVAAVAA
jgi:hypothetical protein